MVRILKNNEIELTEQDIIAEKEFHKGRIGFAFIDNNIQLLINDERDHIQWLREDFGIHTIKSFDKIVRGYIRENKIYIYKTTSFVPVDKSEITPEMINVLYNISRLVVQNASKVYYFYNGLEVGKIGEIWSPIETLLTVEV